MGSESNLTGWATHKIKKLATTILIGGGLLVLGVGCLGWFMESDPRGLAIIGLGVFYVILGICVLRLQMWAIVGAALVSAGGLYGFAKDVEAGQGDQKTWRAKGGAYYLGGFVGAIVLLTVGRGKNPAGQGEPDAGGGERADRCPNCGVTHRNWTRTGKPREVARQKTRGGTRIDYEQNYRCGKCGQSSVWMLHEQL